MTSIWLLSIQAHSQSKIHRLMSGTRLHFNEPTVTGDAQKPAAARSSCQRSWDATVSTTGTMSVNATPEQNPSLSLSHHSPVLKTGFWLKLGLSDYDLSRGRRACFKYLAQICTIESRSIKKTYQTAVSVVKSHYHFQKVGTTQISHSGSNSLCIKRWWSVRFERFWNVSSAHLGWI